VRSALDEPLVPDRDYEIVASELLVDRLAGLRAQGRGVRRAGSEVEALAAWVARRSR
jgi:hypothetical protein